MIKIRFFNHSISQVSEAEFAVHYKSKEISSG